MFHKLFSVTWIYVFVSVYNNLIQNNRRIDRSMERIQILHSFKMRIYSYLQFYVERLIEITF